MGADDEWVGEGALYVGPIQLGAVRLITLLFESGMEHAAVQGAEMELADDHRFVGTVGQTEACVSETGVEDIVKFAPVTDRTLLGGGASSQAVATYGVRRCR